MDGRRWSDVHARLSVGMWGIYKHSAQTATQSFVGNDAFRRSAGETSVYCSRKAYCPVPSSAVSYVTHDKQLTVNTDYWLPVHWKLRILAPGKNVFIL